MRNQAKILPVVKPEMATWTWHSALFSVLLNDSRTWDWIYSNYIGMTGFYVKDAEIYMVDYVPAIIDYLQCPWIESQIFQRDTVERMYSGVKEFLIDSIDNGNYVFAIADESQILEDREGPFYHELFTYGYDLEKNKAYVGDFTFSFKYEYREVDLDSVCRAYALVPREEDYICDGVNGFHLLKLNKEREIGIDMELIKEGLRSLLERNRICTPLHIMRDRKPRAYYYGADVYEEFFKQLERLTDEKIGYDVRAPFVFCAHKYLMKERLQYLSEKGIFIKTVIVEGFEELYAETVQLKNVYLKYMAKNRREVQRIQDLKERYVASS